MAVALSRTQIGPNLYEWTASGHGAGATLYWCVNGRLVQSGEGATLTWQARGNERLDVEVFEGALGTLSPAYPGSVSLEWEPVEGAEHYRIERWTGSAWSAVARVAEQGRNPATWDSGIIEDDAAWRYRIVAVDGSGNDGPAREFSGWMCRAPDVVEDVIWSVDAEAGTIEAG